MSDRPQFAGDLADLPTHAFGHRSLTWWGIVAYMLIEGGAFAIAGGAYLFLMSQESAWPPSSLPPSLLAGSLFTLLILVSEVPNTILKKAAQAERLEKTKRWLVILDLIGLALLIIRGFEFDMLNTRWNDSAYGSILWALMLLHTTHILTDWVDSVVLTALMFTPHGKSGRRFVDVDENCIYWRFVWIAWLPLYLLIYWVPRLA